MNQSADPVFEQVGAYLRAGNKAAAREILRKYLQLNPRNIDAWYWLSRAVETRAEALFCLQQALRLQPDNREIRGLIEDMQVSHPAPRVEPAPVNAAPGIPVSGAAARQPGGPARPPAAVVHTKRGSRRFLLPAVILAAVLLLTAIFVFFSLWFRGSAGFAPTSEPVALDGQINTPPTAAVVRPTLPAAAITVMTPAPPTAAPSSPRIAYQGVDNNIYILYLDSGEKARVTGKENLDQWYGSPDWSPDGSHLAYCFMSASDRAIILYVAEADGSNPRELTDRSSCQFDWTPDSKYITANDYEDITRTPDAASAFGMLPSNLWNFDVHTGEKTLLVEAFSDYTLALPRWSPDGEWLFFHEITYIEGSGNLIGWNTKTGERIQAFQGDQGPAGYASFSPDGSKILFDESVYVPQAGMGIYQSDTNGENRRKIFSDPGRGAAGAHWSPDGKTIAFQLGVEPWSPVSLMVMKPDGSGAHAVLDDYSGAYVWSPDGQWLLIQSNGELLLHHLKTDAQTRLGEASTYGIPDWYLPGGAPPSKESTGD